MNTTISDSVVIIPTYNEKELERLEALKSKIEAQKEELIECVNQLKNKRI